MGFSTAAIAQDYVWEPLSPIKGGFGDVSIGSPGFGVGAGFRYMFVGLGLGLVGLTSESPAYALQYPPGLSLNRNQPLPNGYEEEKFLSMMINGDIIFYFDLHEKVSFNLSAGYYSRNDSILAKNIVSGSRYIYRNQVESGMCFGLGAEYVLHDNFNIGAVYHSERGLLFRLTYIWF